MNVKGQAAKIQPIVPPMRTNRTLSADFLHISEGNRVRDRDGGHIEQAMQHHQTKKETEALRRG
jgi:hypothetical protein